ncbi:TPA: lipoprotein, partial [Listeria monocytogenes]|nr:lipoprotein [Listeria monocytogenes]
MKKTISLILLLLILTACS